MMGTDANALADLDGWTEPHGENGVRLRLEYPLRYGERVNGGAETERCWEHLTFRRPRAREFRMLEATGGIAGTFPVIGALTGLPVGKVEELDGADYLRALQVFLDFLPRSLSRQISMTFKET